MSSFTCFCPHQFLIFKLNGLISIFLVGSSIDAFISSVITPNVNIFDSPKLDIKGVLKSERIIISCNLKSISVCCV